MCFSWKNVSSGHTGLPPPMQPPLAGAELQWSLQLEQEPRFGLHPPRSSLCRWQPLTIRPPRLPLSHLHAWAHNPRCAEVFPQIPRQWADEQTGLTLSESTVKYLSKAFSFLHFHSAIALLGIYPKKAKVTMHKGLNTSLFVVALFPIVKEWIQPNCLKQGIS